MSTTPGTPNTDYQPLSFDQAIQYYWGAPSSDPAIDDYRLTLNYDGGSLVYTPAATDITFVATGLTNAVTYSATLEARNANGYSEVPGTYRDWQAGFKPEPPTSVTATLIGADAATISWAPPTVSPLAPIYWYVIEAYATNSSVPSMYSANGLTQSNFFIPGLDSNLAYYFDVYAVNYPDYSAPVRTSTIQYLFPFYPTQVPGLQIWYDGADPLGTGTAPANGTPITTWVDKSVNSNNATAGNAASYVVDSGGNYLNFNGSNTFYNIGSSSFIANQYFTAFFVERLQVNTNATINFVSGTSTSPNTNLVIRYFNPNATAMDISYYFGVQVTFYNVPSYTTAAAQPTRMWSFNQNPSFLGLFLNGDLASSSANNTLLSSWNGPSIGRDSAENPPSRYYGGHMKEIIFYNGIMTPFNRQKVEGYLAWKWGTQTTLATSHPFRAARPSSNSVFTPTMFSSLQLWLDGSDPNGTGTAPANGTTFTTWSDKSGKNNNATIYSGAPLSYSNNAINTYSAPYMSNSAGSSQLRAAIASNTFTNSFQAFAVFKVTTQIGNTTILTRGTNNKPGPWDLSQQGRLVGDANNFNSSNASFNLQGATSNCLFVYGSTSNQWNEYVFGTLCNTFNWSPVYWGDPAPYVYIGERADGNHNFIGYYGEILLYNRVLSDPDRQTVEGYLAWKWGLQGNLPTTHPYVLNNPGALTTTFSVTTTNLLVRFDALTYIVNNQWINTGSLGTGFNATIETGIPTKNIAGNGVVFNGSTNFTFPNPSLGNSWTAMIWYKRTGNPTGENAAIVCENWTGGSINMFVVANFSSSGSSNVTGGFFRDGYSSGGAVQFNLNEWHSITVSWDGISIRTYFDGILRNTTGYSTTSLNGGNAYRIGREWNYLTPDYIVGEVGQILIYNRALSATEVLQNYAATSNVFSV